MTEETEMMVASFAIRKFCDIYSILIEGLNRRSGRMIKNIRLFILNDYDRPCMYLLATKEPLQYANSNVRKKVPNPTADVGNMTCLEDFGFVQKENVFEQVSDSKATYQDGKLRSWQGLKKFTIEDLLIIEKA